MSGRARAQVLRIKTLDTGPVSMDIATAIRNRFRLWWKRECEPDYVYEDTYVSSLVRIAAERAYKAGWRAAKRDRR